MATPTRLANKTQWALQDILVYLAAARRAEKALQERNEEKLMDPLLSMSLYHLADALNRIEVTTVRAQHGDYGNGIVDHKTTGNA